FSRSRSGRCAVPRGRRRRGNDAMTRGALCRLPTWPRCQRRKARAGRHVIPALCLSPLPSPRRRAISTKARRGCGAVHWLQFGSGMTSSSPKSNKPAKAEPKPSLKPSNPHAPLTKADVRNIFYGLMLGMFLSALNQTIVATALPTIGRDFGDFENLSWVIIAYLLSSTVVSPLYGKLSDIHGRRSMMLLAIG